MRASKTFRNGLSVAEHEARLKLIDRPFTVVTPRGELLEATAGGWGLDEPVTDVGSREYHGLSWARLYRALNTGELIELTTLDEWKHV